MIDLSIFSGGPNRIVLPLYELVPLLLTPIALLAIIIIIPLNKLPGVIKQILSIPLLAALFFIPFGFTNGDRVVELIAGCATFNIFLRHLELYWVGPFVQNRPVYISFDNLWIDFWSCLRTFPKPAKEDTKELKKGQVKQYKKDRKWYHVLLYLTGHILMIDALCSYITTFTVNEVMSLQAERPVLYFFVFFVGVLVLNNAFNTVGYLLHLFYCIFIDKGSYESELWRPLMLNPVLSHTLDNLWSVRWHSLFKSTWLAFPFRPTRIYAMRFLSKRLKKPEPIAYLLASLAVFAASSLMHEYLIASNMGWNIYSHFFIGEQSVFFLTHGLGVILEHLFKMVVVPYLPKSFKESWACRLLQHVWVITFAYHSFYYIMHGFMTWGFQYDVPTLNSKPYIIEFAKSHPALSSYIGTNV